MNLIRLSHVEVSFGDRKILDKQSFAINSGERVVLIGRNGAGKSTLLKVISGGIAPDDGTRWVKDGARVAYLDQNVPHALDHSIYEVVFSEQGDLGDHLSLYESLAKNSDLTNKKNLDEQNIDSTIPNTVNEDGTFDESIDGFGEIYVFDKNGKKGKANEHVISKLVDSGSIISRRRFEHQYPHSWRSKKPVIFRNTPQWFISMQDNKTDGLR